MSEPVPLGESLRAKVADLAERRGLRIETGDDMEDPDLAEHRAQGLAAMREARWRSIIPRRFHRASLDRFDEPYHSELADWSRNPAGRNLVLLGPVGVGKTEAAVAACRAAHFAGLEVTFAPVVEMLDTLRPGGPEHALEGLTDTDRLIVDDLGSERPTDWTGERLFAVVNRRWLEHTPTIITSNLSPADLEEAVGPRMFSRLVGNDALVLRMTGPDRRRRT